MRQRPGPMKGGLVYETLSLVCAEFQIARTLRLRGYNESLLQQIGTSDHQW